MARDVKKQVKQRGYLISFEGGEGAGKSTQARLLAERLKDGGMDVHLTREPGGNSQAEHIRALLVCGAVDCWTPMAEALLVTAARAEHVSHTIVPALARGQWVVCDRFADSTIAYQGAGGGLGMDRMRQLQRLAIEDFAPDVTFILDLPVELGLRRAMEREKEQKTGENRFERRDDSFHAALRRAYGEIAEAESARCHFIDADRSIDAIHEEIWSCLVSCLDLKI